MALVEEEEAEEEMSRMGLAAFITGNELLLLHVSSSSSTFYYIIILWPSSSSSSSSTVAIYLIFFVVLFDHCLFSSPSLIGCFGILWDSSSSSHAMDWIYFFYDCLLTLPIFPAKLTSTSNPPASSAPPNEEECHRNLLVIRWYQNTETSRLDEFKYEGPPEELLCGITAASVDIHFNSRLSFFWVRWR